MKQLLALLFLTQAVACKNGTRVTATQAALDSADQVLIGMTHYVTQEGILRARVQADTAYFYSGRARRNAQSCRRKSWCWSRRSARARHRRRWKLCRRQHSWFRDNVPLSPRRLGRAVRWRCHRRQAAGAEEQRRTTASLIGKDELPAGAVRTLGRDVLE